MKRAIIFAHYDKDGVVDPHVEFMLRAYRRHADRLIVISAGGREAAVAPLRAWCDVALVRENVGHDFCSWKLGVEYLGDVSAYDEILFVNDSIYGPLFDLQRLFDGVATRTEDFWGLVRSHQIGTHIQSFFFCFRRRPIRDGFFQRFWDSVEPQPSKQMLIEHYEVGLTGQLMAAGYTTFALFDQQEMSLFARIRAGLINGRSRRRGRLGTLKSYVRNRRVLNPTHKLWRTLIESGAPFLKIELLRSNPLEMDLECVRSFVQRRTDYDWSLIENHVRRTR